jgi:hypothetical protein
MAHYTGQALAVTLGELTLSGIREVNIPEEHPAPDTTHSPDAHGQGIPGGITYHNGCTMLFVDQSGETSWRALPGGTVGTLVVYPEGNVVGKRTITMTIVVTNRDRVMAYDNAVVFTATFNATVYEESTTTPVGESCLISGEPTPAGIATYEPMPEELEGAVVQYVSMWGLDTDGEYAYINNSTFYDTGGEQCVIDRVPLTDGNGAMLTGVLTRDARYLTTGGEGDRVYDIRVVGNYVYAGGSTGLWILDKTTMTLVGRCEELGWEVKLLDVSSDENYVYVGGFGFAVIDVSDKSNPIVAYYDTADGDGIDVAMLAYAAPYVYVCGWEPVIVYDVSTPSAPVRVFYDDTFINYVSSPAANVIEGDLLVFSADKGAVSVISIADPETPVELVRITIDPSDTEHYVWIRGARLMGHYLVILALDLHTEYHYGTPYLHYCDISDAETPVLVESLTLGSFGEGALEGWLRGFGNQYLVISNNLIGQMVVVDSCAMLT